MNDSLLSADVSRDALQVDAQPVALSLPVGAALFAVRGQVWLTQDGSIDDVIVGPGERFDVKRRGLILVSATRQPARLYVASPQDARVPGSLHEVARARAERLRQAEFDRLFDAIRARLARLWRPRPAGRDVPSTCG